MCQNLLNPKNNQSRTTTYKNWQREKKKIYRNSVEMFSSDTGSKENSTGFLLCILWNLQEDTVSGDGEQMALEKDPWDQTRICGDEEHSGRIKKP